MIVALAFLAAPALMSGPAPAAGDDDIPGFPGDKAPAVFPGSPSCLDMPIESLAADPRSAEVIDRNIPGLLNDSHYPAFKAMSLKTVAALSSGRISKATLGEISHELDRGN